MSVGIGGGGGVCDYAPTLFFLDYWALGTNKLGSWFAPPPPLVLEMYATNNR